MNPMEYWTTNNNNSDDALTYAISAWQLQFLQDVMDKMENENDSVKDENHFKEEDDLFEI